MNPKKKLKKKKKLWKHIPIRGKTSVKTLRLTGKIKRPASLHRVK